MARVDDIPLDERFFSDPRLGQHMGGIHTNTGNLDPSPVSCPTEIPGLTSAVLHYFAASPFFDATSNNATLTTQANYNSALVKYIETREAFEGQLRTMQGVEFVVASEPVEAGAWVIRKQTRRKRPGVEDDVTALGTYFVIGEGIYTAPSLGDVLACRLVGGTLAPEELR